jgi:hypothetical protein
MLSLARFFPWLLSIALGLGLWWAMADRLVAPAVELPVEVTQSVSLVQKIEAVGKLELVRYQLKDVVEVTKPSGSAYIPDAKVLLVVSGEAVGCLDLTKLRAQHVREGADTVVVELPAPELCYHKIDHANSKVYDTKFTLLNGEAGLVDEAYRQAEAQIKAAAESQQILEQTKANAQLVLRPLLAQLTHKTVVLVFQPSPARVGSVTK